MPASRTAKAAKKGARAPKKAPPRSAPGRPASKAPPKRARPKADAQRGASPAYPSPSAEIDARLKAAGDWRAATLSRLRALIQEADPQVVEEVKWRKPSNAMAGVPVWSHDGLLCTGETYKGYVKLTFAKGAALPDPKGLFNAGFGGGTRRAIDVREGESVDEAAFRALVREAVRLNTA